MAGMHLRTGRKRPRTRFILTALALLTLVAVALPAAAAALPPEYGFAWAQPYIWQPPDGVSDRIRAFSMLAPGPEGSLYAASSYSDDFWSIARVGTAEGQAVWSLPAAKGPRDQEARLNAIAADVKGNVVGVGAEGPFSLKDILVVKVSAAGQVLWQKTWAGTSGLDTANAVTTDRAGNVYVAGETTPANGYTDAVILKYSPSGALKWKYFFRTSLRDRFSAICVDAKGYVYATGSMASDTWEGYAATVKLSPLGARVWLRKVTGLGVKYSAWGLKVKGGSLYVAGEIEVKNGKTPMVLKYTSAGRQTWAWGSAAAYFPGWGHGGFDVDASGKVYIAENMYDEMSSLPRQRYAWVYVLGPDGKLKTMGSVYGDLDLGMPRHAEVTDLVVDGAGRVYCSGLIVTDAASGETNAAVFGFPPVVENWWADRVWRYDAPSGGTKDVFVDLYVTAAGDVYAAGRRNEPGVPDSYTSSQPLVERLSMVPH